MGLLVPSEWVALVPSDWVALVPSTWAGPQIGNYLGDAPMQYLWAPIRPFIGGGHTVWPVLPRFLTFKNTKLRPRFRGLPENPGLAFEGSFF